MIRIDLGKEDARKKSLLGATLGAAFSKLKVGGKGGADPNFDLDRIGFGKVRQFVGNLSGASMLLVAAALSAVPHVAFNRYRSYLMDEHQTRIATLDQKIASVTSEIEKMLPYKRELESYEAQKKTVRDRIAAIQELLAQRSAPVGVLDVIGQALPPRAWLVELELKIAETGPMLHLSGRAYSNEDISDYVDRLTESSVLENVELEAVGAERGDGQGAAEVKSFEIVVRPKGMGVAKRPVAEAPANPDGAGNAGAPNNDGTGAVTPGGAPRNTAAEGVAN